MEDYILKEISKISTILKAIINKLNLTNTENLTQEIYVAQKDICKETGIDVNEFTGSDKTIKALIEEHHLNQENISDMAELLFYIYIASNEKDEKDRIKNRILEIYQELNKMGGTISFRLMEILYIFDSRR